VLLLLVLALPHRASANASVFVNSSVTSCPYGFCQAASIFGVLAGPSDALTLAGDTILNDVGLSAGATITTTGTNNIGASGNNAILDFSDSFTNSAVPCTGNTACTHPAGSTFSSATKVWGGTKFNSTLVSQAYTQFLDIAAYWDAQSTAALPSAALTGNWNIEKSSTGVHVYNASSGYTPTGNVIIGCGGAGTNTVTAACNSTDLVVIIVPNGQVASILKSITFNANSGLTDDQLLVVINSTSSSALSLNGSGSATNVTIRGDFFVANGGGYTVGNTKVTTIDGRIFAGGDAMADTLIWNSGVTMSDESAVPEPGTWLMMIAGLGLLIWFGRGARQPKPNAE
jgi:hypothetical protein